MNMKSAVPSSAADKLPPIAGQSLLTGFRNVLMLPAAAGGSLFLLWHDTDKAGAFAAWLRRQLC